MDFEDYLGLFLMLVATTLLIVVLVAGLVNYADSHPVVVETQQDYIPARRPPVGICFTTGSLCYRVGESNLGFSFKDGSMGVMP